MKAKIITYSLIYLLIIEPSLLNMGCTSFYPVEGATNLDDYKNHQDEILIRLKNGEELIVNPKNLYFVDRDSEFIYAEGEEYNFATKSSTSFEGIILPGKIDSEKVIEDNLDIYHLFWLQDSSKLNIEDENLYRVAPDSQSGYWMLVDSYRKEFHKIYNSDIAGIEIQDIDWDKTSMVIALGLGISIVLIILLNNAFADCSSRRQSSDCSSSNSSNQSSDCSSNYSGSY
jgi:hypothetical protein